MIKKNDGTSRGAKKKKEIHDGGGLGRRIILA